MMHERIIHFRVLIKYEKPEIFLQGLDRED